MNRQSAQSAITAALHQVRSHNSLGENGVAVFAGNADTTSGVGQRIAVCVEPPRPITRFMYHCGSGFRTEEVRKLLSTDYTYGVIVVDGKGVLYGSVTGQHRSIIASFKVQLPNKHSRGGQSANRFQNIRHECRQNFLTKVAEGAVDVFISQDKATVAGLIVAGSADIKTELTRRDFLDLRLQTLIISTVDIAYGGKSGFHQAIDLSLEVMSNTSGMEQHQQLARFFENIAQDTGLYCFGAAQTMALFDSGVIERILVWEDLNQLRVECQSLGVGTTLRFLTPAQIPDPSNFVDPATGEVLAVRSQKLLVEWLVETAWEYGVVVTLVSDASPQGTQFTRGFGGIGGILRYKVQGLEDAVDHLDEF